MKSNYLLIDYENVQPKNLAALKGRAFKVMVFVGANQTKVAVEFARALHSLGGNAEYVQISGSGPNALDFHIAFTIGELSKVEPGACFHIISKDAGFDPLIKHMKAKGILANRSKSLADVALHRVVTAKNVEERVDAIVKNLASRRTARPRKVTRLANTINALYPKSLKKDELSSLIQALVKRGHISIQGENVSYQLPDAT